MNSESVVKRLNALKTLMKQKNIDYYLIPTGDYHGSEYVSEYFKVREYFSGFTGSNGTLLVGPLETCLWTDGRYFIQAEKELDGTGIFLRKIGEKDVPTIGEYLKENVKSGETIGFDGQVVTAAFGRKLEETLSDKGVSFSYEEDLAETLWIDRPSFIKNDILLSKDEIGLYGKSAVNKLKEVREKMQEAKSTALILSKLDDIMWFFNIRGRDVECNPVSFSFAIVTMTEVCLFVGEQAINGELLVKMQKDGVTLKPYHTFLSSLKTLNLGKKIWMCENSISYAVYKCFAQEDLYLHSNPTETMKALKNETELQNIRDFYIKDSVAVTKFIYRMKKEREQISQGKYMTEYDAMLWMDELRKEIPGYLDKSFTTISAYGENAAMMHYEAKKEEYIRLIITQVVPDSVNLIAAAKVLDSAKAEDVADFIDEIEATIDKIFEVEGLDKNDKGLRVNLLHEYLVVYLPNSFFQGDNLTTKKININTTRFEGKDPKYRNTPELLKGLAFLENHILAEIAGLPERGIAFDGFRFFYTATGKAHPFKTFNLHQSMLAGADRYAQSNFVLNEDFAMGLLRLPKKFTKINNQNFVKTTNVVDGDTIDTYKTMYRKSFRTHNPDADFWFNINLEMGYFCKVKEYNRTQGTYSFSLFYMPDKEGEQAIQLFRIDKVADTFKGAPASHNLRGKEKIETTLHAHTYNLIDAVLKNYTKEESLGKMDLSHIFPTADGLDPKVVEEFFDCFCGIHGRHLKKVNQQKFAELFNKYGPINYSSME